MRLAVGSGLLHRGSSALVAELDAAGDALPED